MTDRNFILHIADDNPRSTISSIFVTLSFQSRLATTLRYVTLQISIKTFYFQLIFAPIVQYFSQQDLIDIFSHTASVYDANKFETPPSKIAFEYFARASLCGICQSYSQFYSSLDEILSLGNSKKKKKKKKISQRQPTIRNKLE